MKGPRKLFESLKEGDPQAIAVAVVFLFLISVGWFSKTLLLPPEKEELPYTRPNRSTQTEPPERLSELLARQQERFEGDSSLNPFFLEPPRAGRRRPDQPDNQDEPDPAPPKPEPKPDPKPPRPKPTPVPKVETVTYVFNGLLVRPDDVTVAAVALPKIPSSRFVQVGDALPPFTVVGIFKREMELQRGDEPPVLLIRGEPQTFPLTP